MVVLDFWFHVLEIQQADTTQHAGLHKRKKKIKLMRIAQASATFSLERQLPFTQHSNSFIGHWSHKWKEGKEGR